MSESTLPAQLVERLRAARRVAVLTGAGISAERGVPTFREAGTGLWPRFRPEDLATPAAFRRDPTPLSAEADFRLHGLAGTLLPQLVRAAWPDSVRQIEGGPA